MFRILMGMFVSVALFLPFETANADMLLNGERMPSADNGITFNGAFRSSSPEQGAWTVLTLGGSTRLDRLEFEATLVHRNGSNAGDQWDEALAYEWWLFAMPGSAPTNFHGTDDFSIVQRVTPFLSVSLTGSSLARHGVVDLAALGLTVDSPSLTLGLTMIKADANSTPEFGLALAGVRGLDGDASLDFVSRSILPAVTIHTLTNGATQGLALEVYGTMTAVPEPPSLFALGIGGAILAGVVGLRRRRARPLSLRKPVRIASVIILSVAGIALGGRGARADLVTLRDTMTNPNFPTGTGYAGACQDFLAIPIMPISFDCSTSIDYQGGRQTLGDLLDQGIAVGAVIRGFEMRMYKMSDDTQIFNWSSYGQGFQIMAAEGGAEILSDRPDLWSVVERNAMRYNTGIATYSASRSDISFLLPGQESPDAFFLDLSRTLDWQISGSCWGDLEGELLLASQSSLTGLQTSARDSYVTPDFTGSIYDLSNGRGVAWEARITADIFVVVAAVPEPSAFRLMGTAVASLCACMGIRRIGRPGLGEKSRISRRSPSRPEVSG